MVSNAALKSNNTNTTKAPETRESSMSFVTLNRADSVLYKDLKTRFKLI